MDYSQVTNDILINPKYEGAIKSVEFITNWIDTGFGMVITMVAFLIILVAMFKNVLAGAYCAYPKFWDEVDTAHQAVRAESWMSRFKGSVLTPNSWSNESFSHAIMRLLPNIKSLTAFESDTVSAKSYFIRAIPQMIVCIIIGAFIYNGYYRDTAAKVVDFGSEMIERTLLEVNPVAVFDHFTSSAGRPDFSTDNAVLDKDKTINEVSTSIYNAVIGEYNDIKGAEAKRALANAIEEKVSTWYKDTVLTQNTEFEDRSAWKPRRSVTIAIGQVSAPPYVESTNGNTQQFVWQFPVSDLNLSSTINPGADMWVRVRFNLEKQAVSAKVASLSDLTLTVKWDANNQATVGKTADRYLSGSSEVKVNDDVIGKVTVKDGRGQQSVITFEANNNAPRGSLSAMTLNLTGSLTLHDHGRSHEVKQIAPGSSTTITSASWKGSNNSYEDTSWTVGDNTTETASTTDDQS